MNDAPAKLFRDEAQVEALQCVGCGGPLSLSGFGAIETVVCSHCGSELHPEPGGALQLVSAVRRQQRQSMLPLHVRGTFDDKPWEVIGIVWREVQSEGRAYPWQEFLLYNPYAGYLYLLYFAYDRHWALGRPLPGAPRVEQRVGRPTAAYRKSSYRHFQRSLARVTYVEGEFPWQVHVGDVAIADDYVDPPHGLSVEQTQAKGGTDLAFTAMEHRDGADVWRAFGRKGAPPSPTAVGPFQPNRWRSGRLLMWLSLAVMSILWVVVSIAYSAARDDKVVVERHSLPFELYTEEITFDTPDRHANVEITFSATPLSNSWAFGEVLLVPQRGDDAVGAGLEVDEWHGVEDGESWHEGDTAARAILGDVPGGTYTLQVTPQAGTGTTPDQKPTGTWSIVVKRDVVVLRYVFLPFFVIVGMPLIFGLLGLWFEGQRWKNSDYAPSSS